MKKNAILLIVGLMGIMAVGCTKDAGSFSQFRLSDPSFIDADGAKVVFNYASSKLNYEDGDDIYVNGTRFTLENQGSQWVANSSTGAEVENVNNKFYVAYADNTTLTSFNSATGSYIFNLSGKVDVQPVNPTVQTDDHSTSTNGILIAGASSDNLVKLYPACAIIRLATNTAYSYVRVGFDANKIPYRGTIQAQTNGATITLGTHFLEGVTSTGGGSFLYMIRCDDGWYVAVPIVGNSVSTTLYFEWNDGVNSTKYKTQNEVTLQKGYVYSVGNTTSSPFEMDGFTKSSFSISASLTVRFSSGNLQYQPGTSGLTSDDHWRFAPHQYSIIGDNNSNIGEGYTNGWIDLFGWGTSGWEDAGCTNATYAFSTSTDYNDYYVGGAYANSLVGAYQNADWGYFNSAVPGIAYGDRQVTGVVWRTMTSDEWTYLLSGRANAASKRGLATINGIKGLIILPDTWTAPAGVTFSATTTNFTTDNYSLEDWDKLEMAGAVFLPVAGYRNGTSVEALTSTGCYWSTTYNNSRRSYAMNFSDGNVGVAGFNRYYGAAVRLVKKSRGSF